MKEKNEWQYSMVGKTGNRHKNILTIPKIHHQKRNKTSHMCYLENLLSETS